MLTISTSSNPGSVSLQMGARQEHRSLGSMHSENLFPTLEELGVQLQDLQLIAVDLGPGGFTGLRVATNFAKTVSYSLGTPLFAISSFDLLAKQSLGEGVLCMNAFQESLYLAKCSDGRVASPVAVHSFNHLDPSWSAIPNWWGTGFEAMPEALQAQISKFHSVAPSAKTLLELALASSPDTWTKDWKSLQPLYFKGSAAEEKAIKSTRN